MSSETDRPHSDERNDAGDQAGDSGNTDQQGGSAFQRVTSHMLSNKIEAVLWFTRLFTVFFTINFFLPIFGFGNPYSTYQKVLLSNAATSALRLHQRVPNFQISRAYLAQLFTEDSAHYLFYSLIFVTSAPVTLSVLPVFLYAVLHTQTYTKQLLNQVGINSMQMIRGLLARLEAHQSSILRFIACNEIFLMPALIFMLLTGQISLLLPFMYYRFLSQRYASRRNPYCKQLFYELRVGVEAMCEKPQCPHFVKNMCSKAISLVSRLAPPV